MRPRLSCRRTGANTLRDFGAGRGATSDRRRLSIVMTSAAERAMHARMI
jgi:hypothetical protein